MLYRVFCMPQDVAEPYCTCCMYTLTLLHLGDGVPSHMSKIS